jgi:predicted CoA-binding protein
MVVRGWKGADARESLLRFQLPITLVMERPLPAPLNFLLGPRERRDLPQHLLVMPDSSVAVLGASRDRRKYGNKAVRAYLEYGFTVFPVNPSEPAIEGQTAYSSLEKIEAPIDFISLYVPPAVGLRLLPAIAAKHPKEVWINPGAESDELIEAAADLHLRVIVACSIVALGLSPGAFPDA